MTLESADFERLRDLVYERTGMRFDDCKLAFMQARVARRLAASGCASPRDYYRLLRYEDAQGSELQSFIEALTTNESYFFREFPQLRCFANEALPLVTAARRKARQLKLNIWSAGCSTGDEPYTLAIILRNCLDDLAQWQIRLVGTDIDSQVLRTAATGLYTPRAVQDVPPGYLASSFTQSLGQYQVNDEIRRMVCFERLNLVDRPAMRRQQGFDFIFCRNVLIYFDDASRRQVLSSFYDALVPGGYIFLGHAESVGRISAAFEMVRLGETITYRRPLNEPARPAQAPGGPVCPVS